MANEKIFIKKYKGNIREFIANFPKAWLLETGRLKAVKTVPAFSGIINVSGYDEDDNITDRSEKMFFGIMAEYIVNAEKKNCGALYCLKISYPKMPMRSNIIRDIRIVLSKYQIPDQYALWIAHAGHNKSDFPHAHTLFSKLKRKANEKGLYEMPVFPEQARSVSANSRGYSCESNNYLIANVAAMFEISKLYGYDTSHLQYDQDMNLIGDKPVKSPFEPKN